MHCFKSQQVYVFKSNFYGADCTFDYLLHFLSILKNGFFFFNLKKKIYKFL